MFKIVLQFQDEKKVLDTKDEIKLGFAESSVNKTLQLRATNVVDSNGRQGRIKKILSCVNKY